MKLLEKLKSRKFFVCLWSMILISFIIIADREHFDRLAEILALVPLAYSGLNVWQKVKKSGNIEK